MRNRSAAIDSRQRTWWHRAAVLGVGFLGVGLALVASSASVTELRATEAPTASVPEFTVTASLGTIEEDYDVVISAVRDIDRTLSYLGPGGILTHLPEGPVSDPAHLSAGIVLLRVDQNPIIVVSGTLPAYRELTSGNRGDDVRQLQEELVRSGLLQAHEADGIFGSSTRQAVTTWWEGFGVKDRSTVPLGSIVFVADLPRLFLLSEELGLGAPIEPGLVIGKVLDTTPRLSALLTPIQAQRYLSASPTFQIDTGSGEATALEPAAAISAEDAGDILRLKPVVGSPEPRGLDQVGVDPVRFPGRMVVTAATRGTVVPVAALQRDGDEVSVEMINGQVVPVTLLAEVGGEAVVDGIEAGTRLVIK